jgi:hypothetical protein
VITSSDPSATPTEPACDNQERVVADPAARVGGVGEDIDDDGEEDTIFIAVDGPAESGCRAFLVVDDGSEILAAPVWEIGPEGGLPQPRIVALVDVDGEPGAEIVVTEAAGASSEFVGLFTVYDGSLARVTIDGPSEDEVTDDLFAYGGSVGHIEGVGCTEPGTVVASTAVPGDQPGDLEEGIYGVERKLFEFEGATLVSAGTERERVPIDRLERFPEFASGPFGTCEGSP